MLLFFWACDVFFFFFFGVSFFGGEVCRSAGVALVSFGFFALRLCCTPEERRRRGRGERDRERNGA